MRQIWAELGKYGRPAAYYIDALYRLEKLTNQTRLELGNLELQLRFPVPEQARRNPE